MNSTVLYVSTTNALLLFCPFRCIVEGGAALVKAMSKWIWPLNIVHGSHLFEPSLSLKGHLCLSHTVTVLPTHDTLFNGKLWDWKLY